MDLKCFMIDCKIQPSRMCKNADHNVLMCPVHLGDHIMSGSSHKIQEIDVKIENFGAINHLEEKSNEMNILIGILEEETNNEIRLLALNLEIIKQKISTISDKYSLFKFHLSTKSEEIQT